MEAAVKQRSISMLLLDVLLFLVQAAVTLFGCWKAYAIRIYAIRDYGRIIHEFDPWFNYRATEYLHEHGRVAFFTWFDYMSWYPLGRPVGTTIYPGMQFTSVAIFHALKWLGMPMSLNDVCCFVPAWFGVTASIFTGLIAYECTGSGSAMAAGTLIMAIMPAHLMRSIGGGYDNESIAVTAMALTFYLWCRSLRSDKSWPVSIAAGVAYWYMVAAWGGYVFVINMVAAHAGLLLAMGRFNQKLYRSYTLFYAIGTLLAIQIPVVGLTPLKSMEQCVPLALFVVFQVLQVFELAYIRKRDSMGATAKYVARVCVVLCSAAAVAAVLYALLPTGILGPVSLRVRSLFIKHTRTGNPLVDSVAEHKATSPDAYWQFLHNACYVAPAGLVLTLLFGRRGDGKYFLILYAIIAFYFANKMNRLVILLGPVASALCGIALGLAFDWCVSVFVNGLCALLPSPSKPVPVAAGASSSGTSSDGIPVPPTPTPTKAERKSAAKVKDAPFSIQGRFYALGVKVAKTAQQLYRTRFVRLCCVALVTYLLTQTPPPAKEFYAWSENMATQLSSNPHIVFNAQLQDGRTVKVTDYLDGYNFLATKTPKDARILAWWDYGYQITGIGNRTSLADGNTWNQAHIAFIGKMLTSTEPKAHKLIRHMADYVLVWSGGGGDDLAKSPHLARIATSNFPKHCGNDRTCNNFGFYQGYQSPTPMMAKSLLYRMVANKQFPGVELNTSLWKEVFTSKFGKLRIYKVLDVDKESKRWVADPANRLCDRPGSWYCPGQYPPAVWPALPAHFLKDHRPLPNATDGDKEAKKDEL